MAPVLKRSDDLVIIDRSNTATNGGMVYVFSVTGPGLPVGGLSFGSLDEAKARGRAIASERGVSLWLEPRNPQEDGILVESYRLNR